MIAPTKYYFEKPNRAQSSLYYNSWVVLNARIMERITAIEIKLNSI